MSGLNQNTSRPGGLPIWPSNQPLSPDGLLKYQHPAGAGYEVYELPVSRLNGSKIGAVTNGTAQIAGIALSTSSSTTGSWAVTVAHPLLSAPISVTVPVSVAITTTADQAAAIRAALTAAIAATPGASSVIATAGTGSTFGAVAVEAAANDAGFTITAVKTGVASTTSAAANTAGVVGSKPDFIGQTAVDGATVKLATNVRVPTWVTIS